MSGFDNAFSISYISQAIPYPVYREIVNRILARSIVQNEVWLDEICICISYLVLRFTKRTFPSRAPRLRRMMCSSSLAWFVLINKTRQTVRGGKNTIASLLFYPQSNREMSLCEVGKVYFFVLLPHFLWYFTQRNRTHQGQKLQPCVHMWDKKRFYVFSLWTFNNLLWAGDVLFYLTQLDNRLTIVDK